MPLSCSRLRSSAVSVLQDVARPYERNQRVTKRKTTPRNADATRKFVFRSCSSAPLVIPSAGADETIFLVRRSHPETNQCSHGPDLP